jgi:hypothetical protein
LTKDKHGRHLKSTWETVASWFSNPAERQKAHQKKSAERKKILPKRAGELRSRQMKVSNKPAHDFGHSAVWADFSSLLTPLARQSAAPSGHYSLLSPPFSPATSFSHLRTGHWLLQRTSLQKQFPSNRSQKTGYAIIRTK